MADPSSAAGELPQPADHPPRQDFGGLARRIAAWTTNGLATALILVAGLTFGRQVLLWWRPEPAQPASRSDSPPQKDGVRHLDFGALAGSIQTRSIRGNRDAVLVVLRKLCQPAERPRPATGLHVSAAEKKLLGSLAGKQPAESGNGWRIDQLPHGLPLVICSTTVEGDSSPSGSTSDASGSGVNAILPVPLDQRIIAIGLAVPGTDDQWSAYAFQLDQSRALAPEELSFPLPADCTRGITLAEPEGTLLTTFRGPGEAAAWEQHFRTRPLERGWQLRGAAAGQRGGQMEFDKAGAKTLRAEVHFEYDGRKELHGLLLVTPAD